MASVGFVRSVVKAFRGHARFPSEGLAAPELIEGVGLSDHASFWREGWPALMVTDTAPFRYPYYHTAQDTPDKVDYEGLARVTAGLAAATTDLAEASPPSIS